LSNDSGYSSFWNKTLNQFSILSKFRESNDNPSHVKNNSSNSIAIDNNSKSTIIINHQSLLNSYLTYVTLNIKSIMNGNFAAFF
jgi:hypothetical protein